MAGEPVDRGLAHDADHGGHVAGRVVVLGQAGGHGVGLQRRIEQARGQGRRAAADAGPREGEEFHMLGNDGVAPGVQRGGALLVFGEQGAGGGHVLARLGQLALHQGQARGEAAEAGVDGRQRFLATRQGVAVFAHDAFGGAQHGDGVVRQVHAAKEVSRLVAGFFLGVGVEADVAKAQPEGAELDRCSAQGLAAGVELLEHAAYGLALGDAGHLQFIQVQTQRGELADDFEPRGHGEVLGLDGPRPFQPRGDGRGADLGLACQRRGVGDLGAGRRRRRHGGQRLSGRPG